MLTNKKYYDILVSSRKEKKEMKVKLIISKFGILTMEKKINDFIKNKDIVDIKIQMYENHMVALILYEGSGKYES